MRFGVTTPSREEFAALDRAGACPVTRRLLADSETAVGIYRKLAGNRPGTVLLESAEQGKRWARYSFVGVRSAGRAHRARTASREWLGEPVPGLTDDLPADPLAAVRTLARRLRSPRTAGLPPLTGGLVGYLGYDVVRRLERLPETSTDDLGMPELAMMLVTDLAVLDHTDGTVLLIANALRGGGDAATTTPSPGSTRWPPTSPRPVPPGVAVLEPADAPDGDAATWRRASTRTASSGSASTSAPATPSRWCSPSASRCATDVDALDLYRVLRATNPSPYMYLLRFAGRETPFDVVGSSPEALVTVTGDVGRRAPAGRHPPARARPRRRTCGWPRGCSPTPRSAPST